MASLYELDRAVATVLENGLVFDEDTGEIVWDEDNLDELEMARDAKLESVALFVKSLESDAVAMRAEERRLAERRSVKERKAERLRDYIARSMEAFGDSKLETPRVELGFRKSQVVEIENESLVPLTYQKVKAVPDKAAIRKAIKEGRAVEGAALVERRNLQIK